MPIFKKEIKSDFTVVHNAFIRDENLGIAARGLLLTMLSMSDGWNFSVKGLAAILPDGECKVTTAIRELERNGYLVRRKLIDERSGRVIDWEYIISDEPLPEEYRAESSTKKKPVENLVESSPIEGDYSELESPQLENPVLDNPALEKQGVYKITTTSSTKKEISSERKINQSNLVQPQQSQQEAQDRIDMIDTYRQVVKENIEYAWFAEAYECEQPHNRPRGNIQELDEVVELIVECICSQSPTIRVANQEMPQEVVKSRFLKLTEEHISYVFECLEKTTTKIRNIKAYLITALFNSVATLSSYQSADFRHAFPEFSSGRYDDDE